MSNCEDTIKIEEDGESYPSANFQKLGGRVLRKRGAPPPGSHHGSGEGRKAVRKRLQGKATEKYVNEGHEDAEPVVKLEVVDEEDDEVDKKTTTRGHAKLDEEMENCDWMTDECFNGQDGEATATVKKESTLSLDIYPSKKAGSPPAQKRKRKRKFGMGEGRRAELKRKRRQRMTRAEKDERNRYERERQQRKAAEKKANNQEEVKHVVKLEVLGEEDHQGNVNKDNVKTECQMLKQEMLKEKHRERYRKRRERIAKMTPEEKDCYREKVRLRDKAKKEKLQEERKKAGGEAGGNNSVVTKVENKKKGYAYYGKKQREMLKKENPEKYKELLEKERFRRLVRQANMTEEERNRAKMKKYLYSQAYYARKGRYSELPEEKKQEIMQKQRERLRNLKGEKKEHYLAVERKLQKKYFERVKAEDPEKWKKLQEYQNAYKRKRYAQETPEKRERRRYKDKVCTAKRKLKAQLQSKNTPQEDVKRLLEELHVKMWKEFDPDGEVPPTKPGRIRKYPAKAPTNEPVITGTTQINQPSSSCQANEELKMQYCEDKRGFNRATTPVEDNEGHFENDDYFDDPASPPFQSSYPLHSSPPPQPSQPPQPSPPPQSSPLPSTGTGNPSPPKLDKCTGSSLLETEVKKIPSPTTTIKFTVRCSHCSSSFADETQLRRHILFFHSEKCWKCPMCKEVMLSPQEMSQHFQAVHKNAEGKLQMQPQIQDDPSGTRPTTSSSVASKLPATLSKHQLRFHCMRCPLQFPPSDDEEGGDKNKGSNVVKGHLMGFISRENLFAHVKREHSYNFWPCARCNLLKYSKKTLKFHQKICSSSYDIQ